MTNAGRLLAVLDRFLEAAGEKPRATRKQRAFLRGVDAIVMAQSEALAEELRAALDDVGRRAEIALSHMSVTVGEADDPGDDPIVAAIISSMGIADWHRAVLSPAIRQHYERVVAAVWDLMETSFVLGLGTDLPDMVARRVVAAGGRRLGLVDIEDGTRRALYAALEAARSEGLGPVDAAKRIRQYVPAGRFHGMEATSPGAGVRYRSVLIARTETLHAQRVSVAESGRAAGFEGYMAFDNRTGFDDEDCTARDGTIYTYDEMLAEIEAEHPNGTLSFSPVPGTQARESAPPPEPERETVSLIEMARDDLQRLQRAIWSDGRVSEFAYDDAGVTSVVTTREAAR